jgi:hypothetical protein
VKWLESFRGRGQAEKIRAEAYHYRHSLSRRERTKFARDLKSEVKVHEEKINRFMMYMREEHMEIIQKYRFPTEKMLEIMYPKSLRGSV